MSLDKTNLLNSEDSEKDPEMTDSWTTSDGETIEQKIQKGPKWTKLLKSEGETYNIVNRRLILAVARKRFTEEETEQTRWVRDIKDTLESINRPSQGNISYRPQRSDTRKKKKQKPSRYDVDDDTERYREPESMQVLNGRQSRINEFDSGDDVDVEDLEHSSKVLKASGPKGRQFQDTGEFRSKKSRSERDKA